MRNNCARSSGSTSAINAAKSSATPATISHLISCSAAILDAARVPKHVNTTRAHPGSERMNRALACRSSSSSARMHSRAHDATADSAAGANALTG